MHELWVEKYRPKRAEEYVFKDQAQRDQILSWIKEGGIPHLLLSGDAGVGKTTLAKMLLNELNVDKFDILEINASNENSVDVMRNKITRFAGTMPIGEFKYVLLDEADYTTPNSQASLRGIMESYHMNCRFILTCNYPNRIIPAIHSRCQGFHINKLDVTEFTARVAQICLEEGIDVAGDEDFLENLDSYVQACYPDMRKTINLVQQNISNNRLSAPQAANQSTSDWMIDAIALFKEGKHKDARNVIVNSARPEEYIDVYKFMYRNLKLWGETSDKQETAIIIIRDGLVKDTSCADPEINLMAVLIELEMNANS